MAPEPELPAIKFVGVVVQEADGTVRAVDLSGEDLWLKVAVDIPRDAVDVTEFGREGVFRGTWLPERIDVRVTGHRRLMAAPSRLATARTVPPGEPPFPALTVRDDDPVTDQYRSAGSPSGAEDGSGEPSLNVTNDGHAP